MDRHGRSNCIKKIWVVEKAIKARDVRARAIYAPTCSCINKKNDPNMKHVSVLVMQKL